VSLACAYLALVPQALCIVYATLLWSSREAEVALLFAGQLACEAANFALKRLIKEERPRRAAGPGPGPGRGYGMPSSHAQFVFFWAVGLGLFLMARHRPRQAGGAASSALLPPPSPGRRRGGRRPGGVPGSVDGAAGAGPEATGGWRGVETYAHGPWSAAERAALSLAALAVAGLVAWSRVYLGYHSVKQVLVGCGAGTVCAVAWFGATAAARELGLLAWALDLPPARWLRIRDLVVEEDLAQAGWDKWEARRRAARLDKDE